MIGCERCNFHGTCYNRGEDQEMCECFQWYAGENCHINLKGKCTKRFHLFLILLLKDKYYLEFVKKQNVMILAYY